MQDLKITTECRGASRYTKASWPVRYGRYAEIEYNSFRFQFNNNGEIKYIAGTGRDWPHPAEWLKRTSGNDWVYYSTGNYYTGVIDLLGEYYLPCPAYPTNSLFRENPFAGRHVTTALQAWADIVPHIRRLAAKTSTADKRVQDLLARVSKNTPAHLHRRAARLRGILQARISVLPPDCRHVDYDVIPLMITDGCLYNCSFCEVKSGMDLSCRSRSEIEAQLHELRAFFGADLPNYNSVYLGLHDALCAGPDEIIHAAEKAYEVLDIKNSYMREPRLFLFGSGESFLGKDADFWRSLNRLPFYTHVNLGLESLDDATLQHLKKPVPSTLMREAFQEMQAINSRCENIEVTANFLLGPELPATHIQALAAGLGEAAQGGAGKGCIYISPLKGSKNAKELLAQFRTIKQESRFQTFLYLIQRL